MSRLLRACVEHEAAHAVVARHLGYQVTSVRVSGDRTTVSGATCWVATSATSADKAAVSAAGDTWNRDLSPCAYVDLACHDLAGFERTFGLDALWSASRTARQILTARRTAVLALADRLMVERAITFGASAGP